MKCQNCNNEIREGAAFCTSCGTRIDAEAAPFEAVSVETTTVENVIPETGATETVTTTTITVETETTETMMNETTSINPLTPCVSSIPAPPPMPDLPVFPTMPSDQSMPAQQPVQGVNVQPPPGAQMPAAPGAQAQYNYTQGQQYYQQPYQPVPGAPAAWGTQPIAQQTPWSPPPAPTGPKKVNTGLLVGLIAGGIVLVAAAVIIGLVVGRLFAESFDDLEQSIWNEIEQSTLPTPGPITPPTNGIETPHPPSASDNQLVGTWHLDYGEPLLFFGLSDYILIIEHDDGVFEVFESDFEEWGIIHVMDGERLVVEGEWSGTYDFTYRLSGNRLTIIDITGDEAHFTRAD